MERKAFLHNNLPYYKITSHRITLRQQSATPVPLTAPSEAWVYGRTIAGIVGSNPAGVMYVFLLGELYVR
jgi:hypothetical protein